jgi:hypothetical protein
LDGGAFEVNLLTNGEKYMTKLIGITGNRRAGKSTLARSLASARPYSRVELIPFAGALKDGLRAMFPWLTGDQLCGETKGEFDARLGSSPRLAMQTLGTEWARETLGDSVWLRRWEWAFEQSTADLVIVDDVRFENEADLLLSHGATFYHVEGGEAPSQHSSEGFGPAPGSKVVRYQPDLGTFAFVSAAPARLP